jgi:hypothetical protein
VSQAPLKHSLSWLQQATNDVGMGADAAKVENSARTKRTAFLAMWAFPFVLAGLCQPLNNSVHCFHSQDVSKI